MTRTSSDGDRALRALIGVGSNLGDRLGWLRFARARIAALPQTRVVASSSVYETDPLGGPPQGPYLNACLVLETRLAPDALATALQGIEARAGRVRTERNAPRTLDLDVLLIGDLVILGERLEVPHPRFRERAFALLPAAEIAPEWAIPTAGATVAEAASRVPPSGVLRTAGEEAWR
jgi:2-amino-4-hydroxy-6-hydroxymethyldihydropteridine diphosphokinase